MTQLTEGEIERGVAALVPYVQEWGLPLNPEDLQAMAVAVLLHSRSDASPAEIEAFERDSTTRTARHTTRSSPG